VTNGESGTLAVLPGRGQGFFDDRDPEVKAVSPVPILPPSFFGPFEVAPTATGQIIGINLNTLAASILFTPPANRPATAVLALSATSFLVAEEGGFVQQLNQVPSTGLFEPKQTFVPLTDRPEEPSALAMLDTGLVLVTNEGQDRIYVFGSSGNLSPAVPTGPPSVPDHPEPSNESDTTGLAGAPLILVPTLVPGTLDATETGGGTALNPLVAVAAQQPGAPVGGEGEGAGSREDLVRAESGAGPSVEKNLRQLDLYRPPDETVPLGPFSRRQAPEALPWDRSLVTLWEELGEQPASFAEAQNERGTVPACPGDTGAPALATELPEGPEKITALASPAAPVRGGEQVPAGETAETLGRASSFEVSLGDEALFADDRWGPTEALGTILILGALLGPAREPWRRVSGSADGTSQTPGPD